MRWTAIVAGLTVMSGVAAAQSAPVKMGLWESKVVITRDGAPSSAITAQLCVTPETYQKSLGMVNTPPQGCKLNMVKSDKGYTFDGTCALPGGTSMTMRGMESIDDTEHTHGMSTTAVKSTGKPDSEIDTKRSSKFVSASCGAVQPGHPVMKAN